MVAFQTSCHLQEVSHLEESEENPMYSLFPCCNMCFRTLGAICMTQWTVGLSLGPVLNLGTISSSSRGCSCRFCCMMFSFSWLAVSELSTSYSITRGFLFFDSSIFNETSFGWSLNFCKALRVSNSITTEFVLVCLIPFIFILSVLGFTLFISSSFMSFDDFSLLLVCTKRTCFFGALYALRLLGASRYACVRWSAPDVFL